MVTKVLHFITNDSVNLFIRALQQSAQTNFTKFQAIPRITAECFQDDYHNEVQT